MFVGLTLRRNTYATIILISFFCFLVVGTIVSEFFRTPKSLETEIGKYRTLFARKTLNDIQRFSLTNRFGTFKFSKSFGTQTLNSWSMEFPRKLPTDSAAVENILNSLTNIKIREIYSHDAINISNYSLDSPLIEITAQNSRGRVNTIKFGLVNPLNNSTYIYTSQGDAIYHVDAFSHSMDSVGITNFVDVRVFALAPEYIGDLKIYRGGGGDSPFLHIKKREGIWFDGRMRQLNKFKVSNYLKDLLAIKSSMILDKTSEKLQESIGNLFSKPLYTVEIKDLKGNLYSYNITQIFSNLPGLKIERKKNFIVKANNWNLPYIVDREFLRYFLLNGDHFRR